MSVLTRETIGIVSIAVVNTPLFVTTTFEREKSEWEHERERGKEREKKLLFREKDKIHIERK